MLAQWRCEMVHAHFILGEISEADLNLSRQERTYGGWATGDLSVDHVLLIASGKHQDVQFEYPDVRFMTTETH